MVNTGGAGVAGAFGETEFRRAAAMFPAGVTVVTTTDGRQVAGMTVSAFAPVSLHPPQILISIGHGSPVYEFLARNGVFAVNVLGEGAADLSSRFADPAREMLASEFPGLAVRIEATGCPILEEAIAFFDCRTVDRLAVSDHTIFIGRVEALGYADEARPLVYWRRGYYGIGAGPLG